MNQPPAPAPDQGEELAHTDDRIIGKAIRGSVVALVIVGVLFGGAVFLLKRKGPPASLPPARLSAPVSPNRPEAEMPIAKFTDITREAGITFTHTTGAYGEKLLPETMGGGVAFFDYDNDGHQDLLFINSTFWPDHIPPGKEPPTLALYHNDGHGHFTDVTKGSGLDVSCYGMGVAIGDYDNDRSEEHTSELQSRLHLVCRLLLEKKNTTRHYTGPILSAALLCPSPAYLRSC